MKYEVKFRRTVIDKNGSDRIIKETFFVDDAVSLIDAASKVETFWNSETEIFSVNESKVMEVVNEPPMFDPQKENNTFDYKVYKAVIASIFVDEETSEEKEMKYAVLLWATSIEDAMTIIKEYMRQGLQDMSLVSISKSKIACVI